MGPFWQQFWDDFWDHFGTAPPPAAAPLLLLLILLLLLLMLLLVFLLLLLLLLFLCCSCCSRCSPNLLANLNSNVSFYYFGTCGYNEKNTIIIIIIASPSESRFASVCKISSHWSSNGTCFANENEPINGNSFYKRTRTDPSTRCASKKTTKTKNCSWCSCCSCCSCCFCAPPAAPDAPQIS